MKFSRSSILSKILSVRIAVIGPTYPFRGGIAHYTTLLVRHLREHHDVQFYSYRRQYPRWLFPGNTAADPSRAILQELCERSIDALNPLTWWQTARQIVRATPDLLLLQWWTPFWLPLLLCVSLAARRARIPIIYLCHQLVEPDSPKVEWWLAQLGLRFGDGFVAVSKAERALLRKAFPHKIVADGFLPIYDAFPPQRLSRTEARRQLGIAPDERLLLFFGFVRRYKGLRYLLEALAHSPSNVRLLVAGEFWEDAQLYHDLIDQWRLRGRVIIHNRYIPNEEIEPYFVAADALALPYVSGSQSAVGMTALYYGLPIITTSIGGLAETVRQGETGLIVPPADSAALAQAIQHFFEAQRYSEFQANIVNDRERFAWPMFVRVIEQLSRQLTVSQLPGAPHATHASP